MAEKFKKLIKHDNKLALVIDKAVLEKLNIDENTDVEIVISGDMIIIRPKSSRERTRQTANKIMDKYAPVFEKLAKT